MKTFLLTMLLSSAAAFGQINNPSTGNPLTIASTAIPVIVAPNGTIATNGTVTFGTALPVTFPKAWFYFPAGAVSGGSAGLYFASSCSSTTVCVISTTYVNTNTTDFDPYQSMPASPVTATGSNSAYTTATATDLVLIRKTIAGGSLGPNGWLRKTFTLIQTNNANNKTVKIGWSGGYQISNALASIASYRAQVQIQNYIDQAHQNAHPSLGTFGGTGTAATVGTTDTSTSQAWIISCNLVTATDYCGVLQNTDELQYQ